MTGWKSTIDELPPDGAIIEILGKAGRFQVVQICEVQGDGGAGVFWRLAEHTGGINLTGAGRSQE